jgi:hypothetical protein
MLFQLKKGQEAFTAVEGPLAGKSFAPGKLYAEIPPLEAGRFQEIKEAAEKPAKADSKRGSSPSETGEVK